MSDAVKIYGVLMSHKQQEILIKAHCFGDCGKISVAGMIVDEDFGAIGVCCHAPCPHLDKEMDEPMGTVESFGKTHEVYLRKLK